MVGIAIYVYLQIWHSDWSFTATLFCVALPLPFINVLFARHAKAYFLAVDHLADPHVRPDQDDGDGDGGGGPTPRPAPAPLDAPVARDPAGPPGERIPAGASIRGNGTRRHAEAALSERVAATGPLLDASRHVPTVRTATRRLTADSQRTHAPVPAMTPVSTPSNDRFATLVSVLLILIVVAVLYFAEGGFHPARAGAAVQLPARAAGHALRALAAAAHPGGAARGGAGLRGARGRGLPRRRCSCST